MDDAAEDCPVVACGPAFLAPPPGSASELAPCSAGWVDLRPIVAQLLSIARGRRIAASLVLRARIVLGVIFEDRSRSAMARELGVTRDTVRLWEDRFRANPGVEALEDAPRTGRPARITERDQAVVLGLACRRPEDLGRREGRMFQGVIAEEAAKAGHVMSRSSVQRILANAEVKPHLEEYYLFGRKDDAEYIARRDAICDVYTRALPADEIVVCFDEKTGVSVRGSPSKTPHGGRRPATSGRPAQLEQHYQRHGSRTLVGAVCPSTGRLVAANVYPSGGYKSDETVEFLRLVRKSLPTMRVIHLVQDNGPTHRSAAMKAFLASDEGSVFEVHNTPVHASWLNLAENFLSRFSRRFLHGKRWSSLEAFDTDMFGSFEAYQEIAKPMRWSYNPRERAMVTSRRQGPPPCTPP